MTIDWELSTKQALPGVLLSMRTPFGNLFSLLLSLYVFGHPVVLVLIRHHGLSASTAFMDMSKTNIEVLWVKYPPLDILPHGLYLTRCFSIAVNPQPPQKETDSKNTSSLEGTIHDDSLVNFLFSSYWAFFIIGNLHFPS
ncbi:hypothetical protein QBC42DRAFT_270569 [Cladorrhinum samala]|uniref:Uncharacterized protein n=1 Tax=Cladorrhinum samala TaxID=585594 RepID=A0AAV9HM61_9PEZI|nr:hypothetical protein QBC42DRAFT_270569 [Cladorrhinum samala]